MTIIINLLVANVFIELLLLRTKAGDSSRQNLAYVSFFSTALLLSLWFFALPVIWATLLFVWTLLRMVHIGRVARHPSSKDVDSRFRASTIPLLLVGLVLMYLGAVVQEWYITVLAGVSYVMTAIFAWTLVKRFYDYRQVKRLSTQETATRDLPTVSVCIPARNETPDLPRCIDSIVAQSYPKLEILVLDDCSHDKTPAIIKNYAHQGVRFIRGSEPPKGWLAKNHAMQQLLNEATGEIVVFAGVDVRLESDSITTLARIMTTNHTSMISTLPTRERSREGLVFIQPLRYWWELAVPRLRRIRPPVLSTFWAARRQDVQELGGFASFRQSVQPEAHIAKRLKHSYMFILFGSLLGVASAKQPREQYDTAIRTRYPQARRRLELVLTIFLAEVLVFVVPWIVLFTATSTTVSTLALVAIAVQLLVHSVITMLVARWVWVFSALTLPLLLLVEWYIIVRSVLAYEFGKVTWKERNICLPMLQTEEHLPKVD